MWIFGYGSLVWRPGFDHLERHPAHIQGYARRFYQGSEDHRGVPGAPGRVVTLLKAPSARCFGMAYRVSLKTKDQILARLDHREKGGYARLMLPLHFSQDEGERPLGLVYIATPDNPNYLGPAPLVAMVEQISRSVGPSGPNREYLLKLDEALRSMRAEDPHVRTLAQALLRYEASAQAGDT